MKSVGRPGIFLKRFGLLAYLGRFGLRGVIQVRRRFFRPELRVISLVRHVLEGGSGRRVFRSALWVFRKPAGIFWECSQVISTINSTNPFWENILGFQLGGS